ncbi:MULTISPECIES: PAS domain S-box protein [unclassified Flavobacterium]|uniref:PAS domain S-box protein n=1 Tax=unclassified Flavobacterium TaxID=196869 RepID=UPI000C18C9EA|nr:MULTISPECIES: PAS domain S-box protein [unclassified Flavobacterium]WKL45596.1 PAS domain S-box protein [Flavobacterium sp. ZE23DGlu08]
MMNLRNISIKNKLVLMQVFTSAFVLGLCITAFVLIDIQGFKDRKVISSIAIAQVVGFNNVSALEFLDNAAANKILSELNVQNDILNANILDKKGNVFASYTKPGSDPNYRFSVPAMNEKSSHFTNENLFVYSKIKKDNKTIGLVCIRFELSELNKIKMDVLRLGVVLLVVGIGLAFLIAMIIKKYISKPLLNLVTVIQQIKDTSDYTTRMTVEGKDEISILSIGLNDMLSTIEKRDNEVAQSKEQLNEQNTLLQSVIQNMGDGLVVADENGKFIIWNPASEKIIGIGLLDIPEEKWADTYGILWPDTKAVLATDDLPIVKALHGEEVDDMEIFVQNYKKTEGNFVVISARPLKDSAGKITGAVAVFHDITERKNAETEIKKLNEELEQKVTERTAQLAEAIETLRKSEEKYREIVENISDLVHTSDYKGYFTYINPACKKLTGYTQDELIGKHFSELVAPEWKDRVADFYLNQFKHKIDETLFSFPIITKNRELKWVEQTVMQLREGNRITGHKSIMRDITERKAAEQKLKESEGQLQTIFNEAPDALIVINDEGIIMRWNPQAEKIFGWTIIEALGKRMHELIMPEQHRENHLKGLHHFIDTGEGPILNKTFETTALNKQNVEFDIELTVSQATILGKYIFIAFIKDISISKKLEDEKIEADKLVRLNELKLKLILENIGEGIIVTDSQKRIVLSNHMAEEIIGIKQDSTMPTTLDWSTKYDLYYPDEQTVFPAQNLPLEKALKGESTDDVEIIIEDSETKTKKRVIISGRPIIDENNYVIAAVANIKDITYYKELEVALEESEQKYRKLIGFKSDKK